MKLFDEQYIVIEYIRGAYKKFADSLEEFPILGVTFPTHYGYIKGYASEDNHDLDVFLGSGTIHGFMKVNRNDVPGGIETKILLCVTNQEFEQIKQAYKVIIHQIEILTEPEILQYLQQFKREK